MAVLDRHKMLLTTISDELGDSGGEYNNFIEHMKGYVPRGLLSSKKTLLDKFEALASKGHLKPGKYDVLKKISEDSGNRSIKELVEAAERDIYSMQREDGDIYSMQREVAEPIRTLNNTQHSRNEQTTSTTPIQETVDDDGPRPPKRHRADLDRSDPLYYNDRKDRGYYDNKGKKGLLLILNSMENRAGTEKDVENLKNFFGSDGLRFDVIDPRMQETEDLTTEKLDQVLDEVRDQLNGIIGKCYYCFICAILSHGNENGIKTKNGLKSIDDIHEKFNNQRIPNFTGRPKIFFIQACRGIDSQGSEVIDEADDNDESDELIQVPTDADTLLAFATTLGYKSFRRISVGSWFITECILAFKKYYRDDHLEDMLITIREKVALNWTKEDGAKQMPCVWSTLTKRLMLKETESSQ